MISTTAVLLIVLLALFGLLMLAGIAVFFFFLLKAIRDLNKVVAHAAEIFKPLTEGVGFSDVLAQIQHATKVAIELGRRTDRVSNTLEMMHKAIFAKGEIPNVDQPPENASGFFQNSEAEMARKEQERELKKRGIKVGSEAYEPDKESAVVADEGGS